MRIASALAMPAVLVAQIGNPASAQVPEGIKTYVQECVGYGYKQSCCVQSFSRVPPHTMDNHQRHIQIAKCSGVPPKG